jgi:hypothetical protein
MRVRNIPVREAIGLSLSHDLTQIDVASGYKGARFRRGHVVSDDDIPALLSMGREHLSIMELDDDDVHEDDAARALGRVLSGDGLSMDGPEEGKCRLNATRDGMLFFNPAMVDAINEDVMWILATLPPFVPVKKGENVAAFRILPLTVGKTDVDRAIAIARPVSVLPFAPLRVGLVTTGREIAEGRVRDAFAPKLAEKLSTFGGTLLGHLTAGDDPAEIEDRIRQLLDLGAGMVVCTGGMSVDADDLTPEAIRRVADRIIFRGVPSLPGSNLMLAYAGIVPIIGAPACVVHDAWTSFDPLLTRLFARREPTLAEVRKWGVGGLCRRCSVCGYPSCAWGARP